MVTITRVGYCAHCAEVRSPKAGDLFLTYGTSRRKYYATVVQENEFMYNGFTPHIFLMEIIEGDQCLVESICAMNGCGVDLTKKDKSKTSYTYKMHDGELIPMTLKEWNALVAYKDKDYYLSGNWDKKSLEV
jgi:hypothetical protein